MDAWIVRLPVNDNHHACYGPFTDEEEANKFAAFMTAEVDPAFVEPLCTAASELLAWRTNVALPRMDGGR
ncbi:hypothetical protein MF672_039050 [Actinomadura sp. ATCC 31491]|uniref:Uncharacterized protein n=1 Tax=Actinomadura luzonensis TaxID=2805427 RepID=A0ABT0G5V1_9ACTN|nr:hypothetical protein [Actinomadura luzonensis]MCK2219753.1 hypothetical protein [Actinomadura luzonensis]